MTRAEERLGAVPLPGGEGTRFLVWAPRLDRVEAIVDGRPPLALRPTDGGYHVGVAADVGQGHRYRLRLPDGREVPDPASRSQPDGVRGASEVVDLDGWRWEDDGWSPPTQAELVIYELHVGAFTADGTFDSVTKQLDHLADLGVNAVELMPVAEFPGARNWGYDGVFPYAAQSTYGGPDGLRRLVQACHQRGLAVVLDVVYNHLGPEGNVLGLFGPYVTDRYRTPWGDAMNFDGRGSDDVRRYFLGSALQWLEDFHVDALRLDAIHGIVDTSATPFLAELSDTVHRREAGLVIAESDLGDLRVVRPVDVGGLGMDAQWMDDLHHALHASLTGEQEGYYADFGSIRDVATALRQAVVYTGQTSRARGRRHGSSPDGIPPERFVVFAQNHDQVGNRMQGDRLSTLLTFEQQKMAAAAVLLSPFVPLLFMGEEYGEEAPFPYFVSHTDPDLVAAVRRGRAEEFAAFHWAGDPPDPAAETTFRGAILGWDLSGRHGLLLTWHRTLLRLRREVPALAALPRRPAQVSVDPGSRLVLALRSGPADTVMSAYNTTGDEVEMPVPTDRWARLLDSADARWGGPGSLVPEVVEPEASRLRLRPWSAVVLHRRTEPA